MSEADPLLTAKFLHTCRSAKSGFSNGKYHEATVRGLTDRPFPAVRCDEMSGGKVRKADVQDHVWWSAPQRVLPVM